MNDNDLIAQLLTRVEELEQKNAANADHARLANANRNAIAKSLKAAEAREQALQQRVEELERKNVFLGDANMELLDRSKASEIRAEAAEARERVLTSLANFFASVIKSGEPWTETCQTAYDEALEGGSHERKQEVTDA